MSYEKRNLNIYMLSNKKRLSLHYMQRIGALITFCLTLVKNS